MQSQRSRHVVHAVLAALFLVVQATAVAHEFQHVALQHEVPCGLHLVADHLAMAPAPEPELPPVVALVSPAPPPSLAAPIPAPARCPDARAPPAAA